MFLSDHLSDLDAFERRCSRMERFETKHPARSPLDEPVVLFNYIVEIFGLYGGKLGGAAKTPEDTVNLFDPGAVRPALVDHNPQRNSAAGQCLGEKLNLSRNCVASLTAYYGQEENDNGNETYT